MTEKSFPEWIYPAAEYENIYTEHPISMWILKEIDSF